MTRMARVPMVWEASYKYMLAVYMLTQGAGAPETFRIGTKMQTIALAVTPAVDVWSLGCIYSECATWIGLGRSRVKEYQRQRRKELKELYKRDLGDLFHDGHKPLEAVKHNHTNVKKNCRREDFVTTKVIDDIIVFMMWEVKEHRSNAQQLCGASERVLNAAQADLKAFRVQETTVTPKGKRKAFDAPDQPEPSDSDSDLDHETPPHPNSEDLDTPHTQESSGVSDGGVQESTRSRGPDARLCAQTAAKRVTRRAARAGDAGQLLGTQASSNDPPEQAEAHAGQPSAGPCHQDDLRAMAEGPPTGTGAKGAGNDRRERPTVSASLALSVRVWW